MTMACRREVQPLTSNSLVHTSSHFFKVILPKTLAEKKLEIPERFAKKFGNQLSAVATLFVPDDCVWQVGMTKDGRKIWFQDGWHDFVKYYSIWAGYFLVFKYERNSTFQVLIFDMTACEIDYPYNAEESEGQISVHKDETQYKPQNNEDNSKFRPQNKKCKVEEMAEINESNYEFLDILEEMEIYITERHRLLSEGEKEKAINIARLVKPKNPAFMVILKSRNIREQRVNVPAKFVHRYLSRNAKFIKLQDRDGRDWTVKINWKHIGTFRFGNGWARFSNAKNLKEGDICVFELIRVEDFVLKASVFHASIN